MNKTLSEGEVSTGTGLRLELFVEDMEATISFYTQILAFALVRHDSGNYASLRSGNAILGIGPVAKLPDGRLLHQRHITPSAGSGRGDRPGGRQCRQVA